VKAEGSLPHVHTSGHVSFPKSQTLKHTKVKYWLLFCVSVEDGPSHLEKNMVLRGISGPKKEVITGSLKYNEEIHETFFFMAQQPLGGLGRLIFRGFTITL
jgi:hypothetical protein